MSIARGSSSPSVVTSTAARPSRRAADHHRRVRRAVPQQQLARVGDLLRGASSTPGCRSRSPGRPAAAASSRSATTVPRLEPVGQRDHRVVVPERGADLRRHRLRRGQPGHDARPRRRRTAPRPRPRAPRWPSRTRPGRRRTPPRPGAAQRPGRGRTRPARPRPGCRWRAAAGAGSAARGRRTARSRRCGRPRRARPRLRGQPVAAARPEPDDVDRDPCRQRAAARRRPRGAVAASTPGTSTSAMYGTRPGRPRRPARCAASAADARST